MSTKTKPPRTITIDGTEYNATFTYKDKHGSFWTFKRRDHDEMPIMETEAYYGVQHQDGMDFMRLDSLIADVGPIQDADPDLEGKDNEVAHAIRYYRNSIRNMPATLSPGRASMTIGRLQVAAETLAHELKLPVDAP